MSDFVYAGGELEVFARAIRWKRYCRAQLAPYLRGRVLEVGAGLGSTTRALFDGSQTRWVCLEPDRRLAAAAPAVAGVEWRHGTSRQLDASDVFDCILYVDVLEHIEDDRGEVAAAARHLGAGGTLAVLAPAYQWLFSPFDARIGHHRRYSRRTLTRLAPPGLGIEKLVYLDSTGLLASAANRLLLRQSDPTLGQILFWDRVLVPCSRVLDPLLRHALGRSVLAVWRRPA